MPREELATSSKQSVEIAKRIGFPVVAKVVSAALAHKSDIGGVMIGLTTADEVAAAYDTILGRVAALNGKPGIDGVLIAEMVSGGLELVLGAHRDPEMGPVIVFGTGGVDIELECDAALAAPDLDEAGALALIARTKAGRRIKGTRGRPALDSTALVDALIGLSRLIANAGDVIQSVDINPFLLRQTGGVALDGLIVKR